MDDGSHNLNESISLLNMQVSQGVSTVIATPHFYANDETVDSFLQRRKNSFELLKTELTEATVEVKLGAEVKYYQGISRMDKLESLRIEGSKLLLLEMPMTTWTEYMVRELVELSGKSSVQIVLAHIERYLSLQKRSVWERIYDSGILTQVNASFFTTLISRHKALSLLKKGKIQFIGSDCHNITSRPPQIGKAFEIIQKKLGDDYISQMNEYGYSMLEK
jgi:protein-tyrosine phosphatase